MLREVAIAAQHFVGPEFQIKGVLGAAIGARQARGRCVSGGYSYHQCIALLALERQCQYVLECRFVVRANQKNLVLRIVAARSENEGSGSICR